MNSITKISCALAIMSFSFVVSVQGEYTATSTSNASSNPSTLEVASLRGTTTTYTTLVDFQAAAPAATSSEDFETNNAGGAFAQCIGDINSLTNNACFTPGQVIEGLNINALPPGDTVLLPAGFSGLTDAALGAFTFASTTELEFTNGDVQGFAFNVYAGLAAGDVDISMFDATDTLIDTVTVSGLGALPDNQFIGVVAPSIVSRISIATQGGGGELLDNLLFGPVIPPVPAIIPSTSVYSIAVLMFGLLIGMFMFRRKENVNI
jgi:hypothetical protein